MMDIKLAISFLLSALIIFILSGYVWKKKREIKIEYLSYLLLFQGVWCLLDGLQLLVEDQKLALTFAELRFMIMPIIPILIYLFVMEYLFKAKNVGYLIKMVFFVYPIVNLMMIIFSDVVPYRENFLLIKNIGVTDIDMEKNLVYFIIGLFNIFILLVAFFTLNFENAKREKVYRKQIDVIALGLFIPTFFHFIYEYMSTYDKYIYLSPYAFLIGSLILVYAIFKIRVFEISPIARSKVFNYITTPAIVINDEFLILDLNNSAELLFKINFVNHIGKPLLKLNKDLYEILKDRLNLCNFEYNDRVYKVDFARITNQNEQGGYSIILTDITEAIKYSEILEKNMYLDGLTELYNRASFEKTKEDYDDKSYLPLGIIFGDLNGLKLINDGFGHDEGDKILKSISKYLTAAALPKDLVFRIGGDEFVILKPNCTQEEIELYVNKVKISCKDNKDKYVNISFGFAIRENMDITFDRTLEKADNNMYRNKLTYSRKFHHEIMSELLDKLSYDLEFHLQRVEYMSMRFGEYLGLEAVELANLRKTALYHDIGMIPYIDKLTGVKYTYTEDRELVRSHVIKGYNICMASKALNVIADYVLYHHENFDGTGQPYGLESDSIPFISRVIAVVSAYDDQLQILKEHRLAVKKIRLDSGKKYDPDLVESFIDMVEHEDRSIIESYEEYFKYNNND